MISSDRQWFKQEAASAEALAKLKKAAGVELPAEYIELLAYSNGGEGPLSVSPFTLCLDSVESAISYKESKTYTKFFPGFFVFGSNGGGSLLAFDLRGSIPWPVVAIDDTNIDLDESVGFVADDFCSFLAYVGVHSESA